jgi:RimJ/RimL family protein N-acetyltransferase
MTGLRPFERVDLGLIEGWAVTAGLDRYASRLRPRDPMACRHDPEHGLLWYVIVEGQAEVGTVWLEPGEAPGERLLGVYLGDPALFGRGIGAAAIGLALDDCRARGGAEVVTLHVRRENGRAIACYAKLGFTITAEGVKESPDRTAVPFCEMRLRLSSADGPGRREGGP